MNDVPTNNPSKLIYAFLLIPIVMCGLMGAGVGAVSGSNPLEGFAWGWMIGFTICVVMIVGMFGWEKIQAGMNDGKLSAYLLVGFLGAVPICAYLALSMGSPTCIERDSEPQGGCTEYADDAYKPTDKQRWAKFWSSLPVTVIITCLIAALVHSKTHEKK